MAGRKITRTRKPAVNNTGGTIIDAGGILPAALTDTGVDGTTSETIGSVDSLDAGDSSDGGSYVDPGTVDGNGSGDSDSDSKPRKRGRPKGSTNARKASKETAGNLEALLFSLHMMGGSFFGVHELMLTQEESHTLADAMQRVSDLYEVSVIPEKTMAWIQFSIVAASIYGPRYVGYKNRVKGEKRAKQSQIHTPVDPFTTGVVMNPVAN